MHQRDNSKLLKTLRNLTDIGNTLIVVEHDEETIYAADHIVDIGPGAGVHGGEIVAEGSVDDIKACKESITGSYLRGERKFPYPKAQTGKRKEDRGYRASENNLKEINATFSGTVCPVTSFRFGKSSLVNEVL